MADEFTRLVSELDYGQTISEIDESMLKVLAGVKKHNKKGSLQITIDFAPDGSQVKVDTKLKATVPEADRSSTYMFWRRAKDQSDARLTRRDPRQPSLPATEDIVAAAVEATGKQKANAPD
jgi:hypothetical protein